MRSTFGNIIVLMNFLSKSIKEATGYKFDAELGLRSVRSMQYSLESLKMCASPDVFHDEFLILVQKESVETLEFCSSFTFTNLLVLPFSTLTEQSSIVKLLNIFICI